MQFTVDTGIYADNEYGAGTGDFLTIANNQSVTLTFDEPQKYFGFAWAAGDEFNALEIRSEGNTIITFTTEDLINILPNDPSVQITALDNSVYNTQEYYGKPDTGAAPGDRQNNNEPYAFLHFFTQGEFVFDEIVLIQGVESGFETDNHTIITAGLPDNPPGPWVEIFNFNSPTAIDDFDLDNEAGTPITVDVLANDNAGTNQDGDPVALDPTSVIISVDEGDYPAGSSLSGDGKTFTVDGQGEWTVDATTGAITFTPDAGFTGNPTPIRYRVTDNDGIVSNTANVTITYITVISLTEGDCYRTLASPVEQSYQDFFASFATENSTHGQGLWTQGAEFGARTTSGSPNVFTLNSDGSEWIPIDDLTQLMRPGTGVLISIFEEDVFGSSDPSTSGFPKVAEFSQTGDPVSFDLGTRVGTTTTGGIDGPPDYAGFSLLGNPFNTGLDLATFFSNSSGINDAAWVYDINNDNRNNPGWRSTNGTGIGDIAGGIIAAGQGFVVQNTASPGTPSVDFTEDAREAATGTFYGKHSQKPDHLRIELRGENVGNSAWVQLSDQGTIEEHTRGDVVQLYPLESEYAVLSTVKEGRLMDIGHFPYPNEQVSIPLTFESTSTQPMTLTLTDIQVSAATTLYLYDRVTGESIELVEGAEYTFTPSGTPAKANANIDEQGCLRHPRSLALPAVMSKDTDEAPRFVITSNIMSELNDILPSEYRLDQNYPNPFNPATQITFELPQQSDVTLQVFDLTGRQVATLVNETVNAGSHTVNFDAANLSSGVYIYRLQAGSVVLSRKLTLIK